MTICLIDTTVFCNIIRVPSMDEDHEDTQSLLREYVADRVSLLLPMAAIIETGNHVARHGDGNQRRRTARRFVKSVVDAVEGRAPWTPTPFFEQDELGKWLNEFPDEAMRGVGLADLSIVKEFERQCALHPYRHVFIWSLDRHLASYDRPARL